MHIYTHTDNVERSYVNETDVTILVENQQKLSMRQRLTQQKQKLDSLGKLSQTRIEIENMIKAEQLLFSYHKLSLASKNIYFCFTDYSKAFDCVGHSTLCNILKEVGIPDHLTCFLRKLCVELNMEKWTGSKLGKECVQAIYCHPTYLTYMQGTSCEILGWMKHKLELSLPGDRTSDMQMTQLFWKKMKRN